MVVAQVSTSLVSFSSPLAPFLPVNNNIRSAFLLGSRHLPLWYSTCLLPRDELMDQWKPPPPAPPVVAEIAPPPPPPHPSAALHSNNRLPNSSLPEPARAEAEGVKDPIAARKVQKADREKMRRDRLNEHFLELGHTLDPDRPKNDKATILTDTIQMLRDLTAEVNRLKAECGALTEESRELTQEKNELREEKASLKADIDNLNVQYQQRVRVMFPWTAVDPSVVNVMAPTYSYPVPVPVPPAPIPLHPTMQPFPFFGNQNPNAVPSSCSTFLPYAIPANPPNEQPSSQYASTSNISSKMDSRCKSADRQGGSSTEKCDVPDDVATDLELKMPGSSSQQDISTGDRKGKQKKEKDNENGSSSSRYSCSQGFQDSSSNSVGDVPNCDN